MNDFLHFLETSYTAYQAAENARMLLQAHGFRELDEGAPWDLQPQGKYFVVRGGSAVIAFVCGDAKKGFKIAASHLDSPCLKLKENPALSDGHCTRLNAALRGASCARKTARSAPFRSRAIFSFPSPRSPFTSTAT